MLRFVAGPGQQHKNTVLICGDADNLPFALALVESIVKTHPNRRFDICLVSEDELTLPHGLSHLPVRIGQISVDRNSLVFKPKSHVSFATYLRHFSFSELQGTYSLVAYFDCDMLCLRSGLNDLFALELPNGASVGAVRDRFQQTDLGRSPVDAKTFDLDTFPVFNAGMMLVNTDECASQSLLERIVERAARDGARFEFTDQSAINLVLQGEWAELSWHWNFIHDKTTALTQAIVKPAMMHFAGPRKPWHVGAQAVPKRFASGFNEFLAEHFPNYKAAKAKDPHVRVDRLARQNYRIWRQFKDYRGRFQSRLSVLNPHR